MIHLWEEGPVSTNVGQLHGHCQDSQLKPGVSSSQVQLYYVFIRLKRYLTDSTFLSLFYQHNDASPG